ncbi:MAG: hypothetical protein ACRDVL_01785 [Acidimicrobiia bacterium]
MPRPVVLIIGIAFALVACAESAGQSDATAGTTASATTGATNTTEGPASSQPPTSTTQATGATAAGRPVAPDFTLQLGDGGEYTLSQGTRPVYLVFWAEW